MGLSGPEGGIGTDDIRYYEVLSDIPLKISSTAWWNDSYPFTNFLKFIYPFKIISPLNIVIINILGASFLPSLTYLFTTSLFENKRAARIARTLILLCPFIWSNGLIIMRDVWTVSLSMATLLLFLNKKYILSIIPLALVAYLRFGSIFFIFLALIVIIKIRFFSNSNTKRIIFWIGIFGCIVLSVLAIPILMELTNGKFEGSLFRESFVDALIRDDAEGIITKISQLSPIIRTPLLFIFFYFTPFLKFKAYTLGIFNLRTILDTCLTAIWLLISWKYIFKFIFLSFKNKNLKIVTWISIFLAFALSTISLQVRHKVIMMPFLAVMAAVGITSKKTKYDQIFTLMSICIAIFELAFALR